MSDERGSRGYERGGSLSLSTNNKLESEVEIMQKKYTTSNENLVFIGSTDDEEYYLDFRGKDVRGWSFMGLRPASEAELRQYARETEPEDIIGLSRQDFEMMSQWFDYDKFADDMEDDWYSRHDIQAEREGENGETLYLGFGSGTSIFSFFKKHKIKNFEDYKNFFSDIGLSEKKFADVIKVIKAGQAMDNLSMSDEQKCQEVTAMRKAIKL